MDAKYEYLRKVALKAPDDSSIKGVPGIDKHREEAEVVRFLLDYLGVSEYKLTYEPSGSSLPPDLGVHLPGGCSIGVEVTELVFDEKLRAERQRYHEAEVRLDLRGNDLLKEDMRAHRHGLSSVREVSSGDLKDNLTVYWDAFAKIHQAKRRVPRYLEPSNWSVEVLADRLDKVVARKDSKLRAVADKYSEVFLVLFSGYSNIDFELLMKASCARRQAMLCINRIFFVLESPILADWHPVVEL